MKKVEEQLNEYRKRKKPLEQEHRKPKEEQPEMAENPSTSADATGLKNRSILDILALDLLDIYPMRKWREFCAEKPLQCWVTTVSFWVTGQLLAAHVQFGFVYFVLSLLFLLLLNLGVRREGELSAYSVFNPNCERLPGQLTGEHFERDMLMRQ